jgi:hypothetical protein
LFVHSGSTTIRSTTPDACLTDRTFRCQVPNNKVLDSPAIIGQSQSRTKAQPEIHSVQRDCAFER